MSVTTEQQQHQDSGILPYYTLDVFTKHVFEGNPLAIVHVPASLGQNLPQRTRQLLAREFNYSETVILSLPETSDLNDHDSEGDAVPTFTTQIFLPDAEVPMAGHPIIGAATHVFSHLLPPGSTRAALRTKAGLCRIVYDQASRHVAAKMPHDLHLHSGFAYTPELLARTHPRLAAFLNDDTDSEKARPWDAATLSLVPGMTFVFVRLPSLDALDHVALGPRLDPGSLDRGWDHGVLLTMFYVLLPPSGISAPTASDEEIVHIRSRVMYDFEDPATGSASCGLACLLAMRGGLQRDGIRRFAMTQGVEMGRRSEIGVHVRVQGGKVESVELRGEAVEVMHGKVRWRA